MALGLAKLPFRSFAMNEAWMQLVLAAQDIVGYTKALTLTGDLAKAKPQTLRYRLLHQAGRLARSGRRTRLRLARSWPWATDLVAACKKARRLAPAGGVSPPASRSSTAQPCRLLLRGFPQRRSDRQRDRPKAVPRNRIKTTLRR